PADVKSKAGEAFLKMLNNKDVVVRISAVKAISKLGIIQGATPLLALLKTDREASVREEAIKALAIMQYDQIGEAIKQAIADKDKTVRIAGLNLLAKMNIPTDLMVSLLSNVINTKTTEEKQAALLTLGKLPVKNTMPVFDVLLKQMAVGKLPADIQLELAEAVETSQTPELTEKYKRITAGLSPDTTTAAYAVSLFGGDAERGRSIFYRSESAQCLRCHSYDDMGGNAGPRLNGVATRLTRQLILESLINPSARLAPGFGFVTIELKNGKTVSGILEDENTASLSIKSGNEPKQAFPKDQVVKRTNAASSMPVMKNILSRKEIRDVVSFLSTLKEDK
ncbi:MAG: HEAT repeat domain-containing protein, partial [Ferruginibacter sp.]